MKIRFFGHPLPICLGLPILLVVLLAAGALAVLATGGFIIPISRATGGGQVMTGREYTVVVAAGQPDAGQLSGGSLRVNGGVIGEIIPLPQTPALRPRAYLPIAWHNYPQWVKLNETEPNNLFSQANLIPSLPALVTGSHDGSAGGGDVFSLSLEAGRSLEVSLTTGDVNGVQLLAYDTAGTEVTRDYAEPFKLAFNTPYSGTYYMYVFSAPEADNHASYTLTLSAGDLLPGFEAIPVPAVDAERMKAPPQVEPTP